MPNTSILSQDSPNASNAKLRNQISTLQTELASIRMDKTKFHDENKTLAGQVEDLKRKKTEYQEKIKMKMNQLSMFQARMTSLEDEMVQVRNKEARQAERLKKLEKMEQNKKIMDQLSKMESGEVADSNDWTDRLINAGEIAQVKRFSDQVQRAYQEKCNDSRKLRRELENLKFETSRQSRIIRNHEEHITTIEYKLQAAEKNLELSREKAKLIHRAKSNDPNCSLYPRLVAESPLSDDIVAKARARFNTPNIEPERQNLVKLGQKRKSDSHSPFVTPGESKSLKLDDDSPALFGGTPSGGTPNSTWEDNTFFENLYGGHTQKNSKETFDETPTIPSKKKPPNERLKSLAQRIELSSDDESEAESKSPIISRKIISTAKPKTSIPVKKMTSHKENEMKKEQKDLDDDDGGMPFRLKRVKVKPRNPNKKGSSPIKPFESSTLDVSRLVKESNLFSKTKSNRYPNGLGGSSKPVTKKLQPKNRKPNIADFFKNTKLQ